MNEKRLITHQDYMNLVNSLGGTLDQDEFNGLVEYYKSKFYDFSLSRLEENVQLLMSKEFSEINAMLLLNPKERYGETITFSNYETLKKVKSNLNTYKGSKKGFNSNSNKNPKTYKWLGNEEDLKELFHGLKTYLSKETSLEIFTNNFSGCIIEMNHQPILWRRDSPSEALYLIVTLMDFGLLKKPNRMDYIQFKSVFVNSDNTPFKSDNLKELKARLDTNLSEKHREIIKEIVKKQL